MITHLSPTSTSHTRLRTRSTPGFTLLELVLALTLVSIIVILVFSSLRMGVRAWEKGENVTEGLQQTRIVLELVRRQIAALQPQLSSKNTTLGNKPSTLQGEAKSLSFPSRVALDPAFKLGTVKVVYRVKQEGEQETLFFSETPFLLYDSVEEIPQVEAETPLLRKQYRIEFGYLAPGSPGPEGENNLEANWISDWGSDSAQSLPAGIRLRTWENEGADPLTVIIPLLIREAEED